MARPHGRLRGQLQRAEHGGGGGGGANSPPVLNALSANPTSTLVTSGQPITLQAQASDPDGDTLSYDWSSTGGTLSSTAGQLVYWLPPSTPGTYVVSLAVTDSHGLTTSGSVNVVVDTQGQVTVSPAPSRPAPSPSPTPAPIARLEVHSRSNVFAWDWHRGAIDVHGWGPSQVALQSISAPYTEAIVEYESVLARQIALVPLNRPVTLDLRGTAWVYVVGTSPCDGVLSLAAPGHQASVSVTQVVSPLAGLPVQIAPDDRLVVEGGQAYNDVRNHVLFYDILAVSLSATSVSYQMLRAGDQVVQMPGTQLYLGFTDTSDGLADNQGAWTLFEEAGSPPGS